MKCHILLLAAVLSGVPVAAAPIYTLTEIGGLGGARSEAFAISAGGAVAGTALDIDGRSHGFSHDAFLTDLGVDSDIRDINSAGTIVGSSGGYATIWKDGSAQQLGTLGGDTSAGFSLNGLGHVTGAADGADGLRHAFLYADGRMIDIGTLGGASSGGYALNDSGQVVGVSQTRLGQSHAFLWDKETGMRDLGTLGGRDSRAMAINSSGMVAGAATNRANYFHASVWGSAGVIDLGTLGGAHSYAYGINDGGVVVGWSHDAFGRSRAFVWSGGMLFDLNDLVSNAPGWQLTAAYGINENGQIVGTGLFNGQSAAFRLDPFVLSSRNNVSRDSSVGVEPLGPDAATVPEPAGTALFGIGSLLLWRWKKMWRWKTRLTSAPRS